MDKWFFIHMSRDQPSAHELTKYIGQLWLAPQGKGTLLGHGTSDELRGIDPRGIVSDGPCFARQDHGHPPKDREGRQDKHYLLDNRKHSPLCWNHSTPYLQTASTAWLPVQVLEGYGSQKHILCGQSPKFHGGVLWHDQRAKDL